MIVPNQGLHRGLPLNFSSCAISGHALPVLNKCSYTVVMKDAIVRARIDADLKANAARVLAACGLELSDAIRLYLQQVVAHRRIPFEIRSAASEPSMAELQVLKRKSQERDHRIARSVDVSKGQMLLLKPGRIRGAKVRWPKASLV
jgi:DNA-damage-inducible protein J